jgi:uncharacterized protein (TIGR03437 family)
MRLLHCVFLALAVSCSVPAQTYTISTIAGGALPVNIPGTSASLRDARAVAVDGVGNVFFTAENVVLRLDAITGILSLVAGNGTLGFSGDNGPATSAQLSPSGVAVDSVGNLYIAGNNRIREVSGGVITTVAGNGTAGFSGDNGPATSAQLNSPSGVAVDTVGNLYIVDEFNSRVRKVSGGVITTVAGNGGNGFSGDNGPATSAQLGYPQGVAVDSAGNLYFGEFDNSGNNRIRKVSGGVITTVAGNGTSGFSGDGGPATSAQLGGPSGVAVDSAGNLFIADSGNNRIRKVSGGVITTVAGHGGLVFLGENGPATGALVSPAGVVVDLTGNLYIADGYYNRIRKVSGGVITTVAGGGSSLGDNGPATSTQLSPNGVAVDSSGNLYIADSNDHRIRKVSGGVITTVAGNGTGGLFGGFSGDNGPATSAQLGGPQGVTVDTTGNLYIADDLRIRKVSGGVITTVAGNGTRGFSGDNGPATSAQLGGPAGVAVDTAGNLYIADYGNHDIRRVSNGVITTVAGNVGRGFSGDNGPATSAQLSFPSSVAVDSDGNLFIADSGNNRIRKVSGGVITTVAGNGAYYGFSGDNGPATSAVLRFPTGVALDSDGNLYIADEYLIRKVSGGVITTVAGGGSTFGDNGPATSAQLVPNGVAVDSAGNVYVADSGNGRVRLLQPQPPSIAAVTNAASNLSSASISPGEIITLYGISLGPSQLMQAGGGLFATQLAGATITINGVPAPIIYTSASQTAVIVPYATTGATAQITLAHLGKTATFQVPVASSAPGIFTYNSTGKGPAAALNQDGITVNTVAKPAQTGDVISLFATGEGQTSPAGVDGQLAAAPLPQPVLPVTVTIGGQNAQILYAGGAPGLVAGLMQINVRIPSGIQTGPAVPVAVRVGNASSQAGVTIAVR